MHGFTCKDIDMRLPFEKETLNFGHKSSWKNLDGNLVYPILPDQKIFSYTYEINSQFITTIKLQVPSMSTPVPLRETGQVAGGPAVELYTIRWSDSTEGIRVSK